MSREPNGRPLVKTLLFAYVAQRALPPQDPLQCFIKFSGAPDSDVSDVRATKRQEKEMIAASIVSFYNLFKMKLLLFFKSGLN